MSSLQGTGCRFSGPLSWTMIEQVGFPYCISRRIHYTAPYFNVTGDVQLYLRPAWCACEVCEAIIHPGGFPSLLSFWTQWIRAHGILMSFAWMLLFPLGTLLPQHRCVWFNQHCMITSSHGSRLHHILHQCCFTSSLRHPSIDPRDLLS